jgi:hypothetical protein
MSLHKTSDTANADAMTAEAKRLLAGEGCPADPQRAAQLLARADELGSGEAAALIACLIAADAADPAMWPHALGYLRHAADLNFESAQRQLLALADRKAAGTHSEASDRWQSLRASVDIARWLKPPATAMLSSAPHIAIVENFLPPQICDWIMERARPRLGPARVFYRATGEGGVDSARTNSAAEFDILSTDLVFQLVRARIAAASGFAARALEDTHVLHYKLGQQFTRHFDFLDPAVSGFAEEIARGGQRVATFLIYLNEEFDGAETEFPLLDIRYRGKKGDALFFRNVEASGALDRKTLHAGLAPTSGEKWLLSQWIRQKV